MDLDDVRRQRVQRFAVAGHERGRRPAHGPARAQPVAAAGSSRRHGGSQHPHPGDVDVGRCPGAQRRDLQPGRRERLGVLEHQPVGQRVAGGEQDDVRGRAEVVAHRGGAASSRPSSRPYTARRVSSWRSQEYRRSTSGSAVSALR